MNVKNCSKCKKTKPITDFDKDGYASSGFRSRCRVCKNAERRAYYVLNKDRLKHHWRTAWAAKSPQQRRRIRAKRYGITPERLASLLEAQQESCAICKEKFTEGNVPCVDHDHSCCIKGSCGKCVRGLLCNRCNKLLGLAQDDPNILQEAIRYLLTSGSVSDTL